MILTCINQKGGVGKTTTVGNLAAYLTMQGKSVLLIDLDPQKNLTSLFVTDYLLLTKEQSIYSSLIEDRPLPIMSTRFENLFIVPSNIKLASAESELKGGVEGQFRLQDVLKDVKNNYDFVMIDCGPTLGFLVVNALTAADGVIIPISHGGFEQDALLDLLSTIKTVKNRPNGKLRIVGFIQTVTDTTNLCEAFKKDLINSYGKYVFESSIPRAVAMPEALKQHVTIFEYKTKPMSKVWPVLNSYKNVSNELLAKINATN